MNERTCGNCRWWKHGADSQVGQCSQSALALPEVYDTDFCGEWADKNITPEQEERRELVRRFAVAIVQGVISHPTLKATQPTIWKMAQELADAEPK